jgi:uncharacterized membrane protein
LTIESNRKLGGIGACLTIVGAVSTALSAVRFASDTTNVGLADLGILGASAVASMLALVGFILFLVAMNGFSRDYGERKIFTNIIYGFIAAIVSAVIIGIIWLALVLVNVFSSISSLNASSSTSSAQIQALITPYMVSLMAALSIVQLVWIFFNYKAFNLLAEKSQVQHFRTAAKIFVLGAIVNIAVAAAFVIIGFYGSADYNTTLLVSVPGGAIQYIAWTFAAKGYFNIKPPAPTTEATPTFSSSPASAVRYCMHCGTQNQADSAYCIRCGQKMA